MTENRTFLWGASSSPHQIEGNNVNSDWWERERRMPGMERSGDAVDSYHRFAEDMRLLADAGLNAYRFGIEWARIEPIPGEVSRSELAHYRRMIDTARNLGLQPVITLNHFTSPRWFAEAGGWMARDSADRFSSFVAAASAILGDVKWVATMNEPNMLAMMVGLQVAMKRGELPPEWKSPTIDDERHPTLPVPDPEVGDRLIEAHVAARDILRQRTDAKVGWTVANRAFEARPGAEAVLEELQFSWEDKYLEVSKDDDFVGVQSYSAQWVGMDGIEPHPPASDNTQVGTSFRPDALGLAVRHTTR
ncbi:family 1 glycosylhydrolase [Leifsonia sp. 2MCAF36]|uniref:family 1 glycosylhydrolase n=1 Tax=Leifsonia sp. 2MCAF36 TaxID=3232988 RepID=UPI003F9DA18E